MPEVDFLVFLVAGLVEVSFFGVSIFLVELVVVSKLVNGYELLSISL